MQLIDVKAKVGNIGPVKHVKTWNNQTLQKQEATIVDHTTSINLILWEKYCETLADRETYALENLPIKETHNSRHLNTPKSKQFFEQIPPFTDTINIT